MKQHRTMFKECRGPAAAWPAAIGLAAVCLGGPAAGAERQGEDDFAGYDFGRVVTTLSDSIDPLEREMSSSFGAFVRAVDEADALIAEGETREAIERCLDAVEGVREARERVLGPMWEGQRFLSRQIGEVRLRLARALEAEDADTSELRDARTEKMLDDIARRIPQEADPIRKKWLIAHYRTVRDLGRVRAMAEKLSPDQRALWVNVLSVLDEASLAHQQVLMGSEVLFTQFDATARRLDEYVSLLETVEGASKLLTMVRGLDGAAGDMSRFTESMTELQDRLGGFNQAVEKSLQKSLFELEGKIDDIRVDEPSLDGRSAPVASIEKDRELADRIARLRGGEKSAAERRD